MKPCKFRPANKWSMAFGRWLLALFLHLLWTPALGSIVSKSSLSQCTAYGNSELRNGVGAVCSKKLVVAMAITANEGAAQKIEAKIARVTDTTGKDIKNSQLQNPLRIIVKKSPVLINYRLFQVGLVANYPHEIVRPRTHWRCRDDWFAGDWELACSTIKNRWGERIFDSQGKCCHCSRDTGTRGNSVGCARQYDGPVGHCLKFDKLSWFAFGLYPPQLQFTISVSIERLAYSRENGEEVWERISRLDIGPHKRTTTSSEYQVRAEYVADFNPSSFVKATSLSTRYLLIPETIPDPRHSSSLTLTYGMPSDASPYFRRFVESLNNATEWMVVPKPLFDFTGKSCNRIGVGYSTFRHQPRMCSSRLGSCLDNQPFLLWKQDIERQKAKRPGDYMLYNYGKVHSVPRTSGMTDYQVNFIATNPAKSLITISIAADDITIVEHKSFGRIVEAYIESFESLSATGVLNIIIQNTGRYTAVLNVFVLHCSAGIDSVPAISMTLDPNQVSNVSFVIYSYHATGKVNHCKLELVGINGELLDNMTITFETLDTCFCYGYCGCACGDANTTCPESTTAKNGSVHIENIWVTPKWLLDLQTALAFLGPTFVLALWIWWILGCLGALKILHMIITGEIKVPEPVTIVVTVILKALQKVFQEWFPRAFQACSACCEKCVSCCVGWSLCVVTAGKSRKEEALVRKVGAGWRIPPTCDGMCKGAKFARRRHRKLMRVNKRKGMKNETPWYQRPYKCTCKVKENMSCLKIIKGVFFFYYCLLLPLIWTLHYLYMFVKRKWKRHKRKKTFRGERASGNQAEDQAYLQLDKYSRGKIEREIIEFDAELRKERKERIKTENIGFNPEDAVELLEPSPVGTDSDNSDEESGKIYASSEVQSSDTSDPDEAGDVDELLTQEHPVYFNYPIEDNIPPSMKNVGKMLSVRGRLRTSEKSSHSYQFDLYKYTYQVKDVKRGKVRLLKTPKLLTSLKEFEHSLDREQSLKLVTIAPLFPCLNDTTSYVIKQTNKLSIAKDTT